MGAVNVEFELTFLASDLLAGGRDPLLGLLAGFLCGFLKLNFLRQSRQEKNRDDEFVRYSTSIL